MRCAYINLAGAADRRAHIERHFAEVAPAGATLIRFEAIDAQAGAALPGAARPAEKACFRSHRDAIDACHDGQAPLLVLEDDARLSPQAFTAHRLPPGDDWDLLFTDVILGDPGTWLRLGKTRAALMAEGRVRVLDLAGVAFGGSAAYVVNGRSKARVLAALDAVRRLDAPYDLTLRALVHAGRLKACFTFPFLTTVAEGAGEASQIQASGDAADRISNAFRRLMFVGRDQAASRAEARAIAEAADEDSRLLGMILAGVASDRFGRK